MKGIDATAEVTVVLKREGYGYDNEDPEVDRVFRWKSDAVAYCERRNREERARVREELAHHCRDARKRLQEELDRGAMRPGSLSHLASEVEKARRHLADFDNDPNVFRSGSRATSYWPVTRPLLESGEQ